jgi:23S rRNA (uracil1939-C5)-methyltransferase
MSDTVVIDRLGAQGDGIVETPRGPVYVPFTLPGERVALSVDGSRGVATTILETSPQRVAAHCRHFGVCGGCSLQHLEDGAYRAFKRGLVVEALARQSIEAPVGNLLPCAPRSRRRAVFSARLAGQTLQFGYNRALSNEIVDIVECPVIVPEIASAIPTFWSLAALLCHTRDAFHLVVTLTTSGLDVAAIGCGPISEDIRKAAVKFALRENLARLSADGEVIVEARKPFVRYGTAMAALPPGGFLQAVAAAEGVMAEMASEHLRKAKRAIDLFAGAGAFTFRLALTADVHAVEADQVALSALDRASRATRGLRKVTVEKRDLYRRPVTARELDAYDGLVLDPPRAGAEDQSKQIARSQIPFVAAVSCNPVTLARDLRILIDGGYAVKSITPVDQFLWSAHVEVVALLTKPKPRR